MTTVTDTSFTRADFLKGGGALVVVLGVPAAWPGGARAAAQPQAWPEVVDPASLDSWLAIHADGSITAFTGKMELGQGNRTALAQIVAEELDVRFDRVRMLMGDTARTVDQGSTVGSQTIDRGGTQLRHAAANGRRALVALAAERLGVPASELTVSDGVVSVAGDRSRQVSYQELVGGRLLGVAMPVSGRGSRFAIGGAKPKDPSQYTIVGKSVPRVDIPGKVTGGHVYIQDVRLPGMLHGRVIRPKGLGSRLISYGKPPRGVKVVRLKDFLGVVAENEWDAIRGARELKVQWSDWAGLPSMAEVYDYVLDTPSIDDRVVASKGDALAAYRNAPRRLSATYTTPVQTHGTLGPSCAIADVRDGSARIWSGTQGPNAVRSAVADALGFPLEKVRVIAFEASGCYGRNGSDPATVDAALMSQLVGRPVRVQWSREDEHGWDPKCPPTVHRMLGGLDEQGNIVAWDHQAWLPAFFETTIIGSVLAGRTTRLPSINLWEAPLLYDIPASRQLVHYQGDVGSAQNDGVGLISAWLRSPVQTQATFAMESFFDELIAAAGADPVELRLRLLRDPRMIAVLKAAARAGRWQTRPSPSPESRSQATVVHGRGVATSLRGGTYNAAVAHVEVNRKTGRVRVEHIAVSQDNGLTVNPRAVKLGIEAGVVQTVSRTLIEECTWNRSNITSLDWVGYPSIRFMDVPTVDVVLIDRPDLPATGSGEPSVNPIGPAISNAIYDATGVRLRNLPFRPHRVLAALRQQTV